MLIKYLFIFKETIVSSNVEDLIDVMAKRRLAIKNLEVHYSFFLLILNIIFQFFFI